MSTQQSMTDAAFGILSLQNKPMEFKDLWAQVSEQLGMSEETAKKKISKFYSNLSMDNRFTQKDSAWTLKSRLKFEETHVDTSAIEIDDDIELEDEAEELMEEFEEEEENQEEYE